MRITLTQFLSVDGVVQSPGAPDEDPDGGFRHGGWVVPHIDEGMGEAIDAIFAKAEAFLFGRRTYEIFAGHWPHVDDPDEPVAAQLNGLPKYVASTTLTEVSWSHASLLGRDVPAEVAELRSRPGGELQVHGSRGLAQTLMRHGLIDEYRLLVFPVVLGEGKRLFPEGSPPAGLRLIDSRRTARGIAVQHYETVGQPPDGDVRTAAE